MIDNSMLFEEGIFVFILLSANNIFALILLFVNNIFVSLQPNSQSDERII
jgi:hypothetical protein